MFLKREAHSHGTELFLDKVRVTKPEKNSQARGGQKSATVRGRGYGAKKTLISWAKICVQGFNLLMKSILERTGRPWMHTVYPDLRGRVGEVATKPKKIKQAAFTGQETGGRGKRKKKQGAPERCTGRKRGISSRGGGKRKEARCSMALGGDANG